MTCNRRAPGQFPFAATASHRKGSPSLLSWCLPSRNGAPRASRQRRHATPAFRAPSRLTRSWLPSLLQLSKLSRSFGGSCCRLLDRRTNHDIAAIWSWHRAADQNHFLRFTNLHHLEILHGHAFVAHVTGHSHVLPNPSRRRTIADSAVPPVSLRA